MPHLQQSSGTSTNEKIRLLLENARKELVFSGYQLSWGTLSSQHSLFGGKTSYWPNARKVDENTLFDLGSMTKAICTTSIIATAVQEKRFDLEKQVSQCLPEFMTSWIGKVHLKELLAHCGGFRGWLPIYKEIKFKGRFLEWLHRKQKDSHEYQAREKSIYSDIGMLLLGEILDKQLGPLAKNFEERVVKPLKLKHVTWGTKDPNVAATEYCTFRKRLLVGEVFDENCFQLGGICSHAGLFSTSEALVPWCREWLLAMKGKSNWLSKKTADFFTKKSDLAPNSTWAYGWDTRSEKGSTSGQFLSTKAVGHLGFPGTSVWLDPEKELYIVFLTNRIHPTRNDARIQEIRPLLHDAVVAAWKETTK